MVLRDLCKIFGSPHKQNSKPEHAREKDKTLKEVSIKQAINIERLRGSDRVK